MITCQSSAPCTFAILDNISIAVIEHCRTSSRVVGFAYCLWVVWTGGNLTGVVKTFFFQHSGSSQFHRTFVEIAMKNGNRYNNVKSKLVDLINISPI